jgi:hypothetical protein
MTITDGTDADAVTSFRDHLQRVMPHISDLLIRWRKAWATG